MATTRAGKAIPINYPKRGEIYLTALDPTVGHETRKTRPALVIQNDTSNRPPPRIRPLTPHSTDRAAASTCPLPAREVAMTVADTDVLIDFLQG